MTKVLLALVAIVMGATAASAQEPTLAGKTVSMVIASGPGGGFDLWGRTVGRHLGQHLPGKPNVVPQNMPGAGGFVAVNHVYTIAPKDGTAMAIVPAGTMLGPIMGAANARFDPTKFAWVGTPAAETPVCVVFNRPQGEVKTYRDLYQHELVVGSTGPGSGPYTWPKAIGALLGMKFKVVAGFPSTANIFLAIERGEIDGICTIFDTVLGQRPDWIPGHKATLLFHGGGAPNPALEDVPYVGDLAKTADARSAIKFLFASAGLGRPIIAPPDMTADRSRMLQDAFMATMRDPTFLDDARKQKLTVESASGDTLAALVKEIYATPKPIVDKVAELIK